MKTLRPRQELALKLLYEAFGSGLYRVIVAAATGFGKTVLAGEIVSRALAKGNRVMFVVPRISLINQTVERFYEQGITEIGVIQGQHPMTDYSKPVQIASIQTLEKRKMPHVDLVIIDEAHELRQFYFKWFEEWNKTHFVGLSATPWREGLGADGLWQDLVCPGTLSDLIEEGLLSKFEVFAGKKIDVKGVSMSGDDFNEKQLSVAARNKDIVCDIPKTWIELAENRPTLIFCVDRAHASDVQIQFEQLGIECGYIDGNTPLEERDEIGKRFNKGDLKLVSSVGCLTTGVDWDVRCIVLARPTRSEMLFVQIIGRGLRTAEGKENCLIIDHTDTHEKLGFVTDIHYDELCDGTYKANGKRKTEKEEKEQLPNECASPDCKYIKPAGVHKCPACGFEPKRRSDITAIDGKMKKITGSNRDLSPQERRNKDWKRKEKEYFYGELMTYADEKNYKDGWIARKYKDFFGVWPNHVKKSAEPKPISQHTAGWIKSEIIRFAKSQQKKQHK